MQTMKTKYLFSSAIILATSLAGCSDSELAEITPTESGQVVHALASTGAETRVSIVDNGSRLDFTWEDNDKFLVINGTQTTEFTLTSGAGQTGATFTGSPAVPYQDGEELYAVFNKSANASNNYQLDSDGNMFIDLSGQTGQLSDDYQFLFAKARYDAVSQSVSFAFENLVSVLKVNLTLPEGVTKVDSVALQTNNGVFDRVKLILSNPITGPNGTHDIGEMIAYENDDNTYKRTNQISVNNVTVNNGVATAYFYVLSARGINQTYNHESSPYIRPDFVVYSDDNTLVSTTSFNDKEPKAGKTYNLESGLFRIVPFANEATADGWDTPYEIANADQMYSLMLRSKLDLSDRNGQNYRGRNYILTDNINLDKELPWSGIDYNGSYGSVFDGNNKTISGKLINANNTYYNGFFSYISSNSTVKNLNMATTFEFPEKSSLVGMIVGRATNCTIENCHVSGSINAKGAKSVGAIVGCAGSQVKIYGCSATGTIGIDLRNIWYGENYTTMGAIVGDIEGYDVEVAGCHSKAHFNVAGIENEVSYHAGIVGHVVSTDSNVKVYGCWASVPMTIEEMSSDHILNFGGIGGYFNSGSIHNCYWDGEVATYVTCDTYTSVTECGSFTGTQPAADQIADMNNSISAIGYQYDTNGNIAKDNSTTINPFNKVPWNQY